VATVYYTASSLDGYIAGPGHTLDWLLSRDHDPDGPQAFGAFMPAVGAAVMGANTYQWILDHGDGQMPAVPTFVLTHRDFPPSTRAVRFTREAIAEVHAEATAAADGGDVWLVGGGELVGQFHDEGLLDEVHVQFAPAMLGAGAPLLPRRLDLDLLAVDRNRDFMCGQYRVRR
jgi:dihydrofolate reductase